MTHYALFQEENIRERDSKEEIQIRENSEVLRINCEINAIVLKSNARTTQGVVAPKKENKVCSHLTKPLQGKWRSFNKAMKNCKGE